MDNKQLPYQYKTKPYDHQRVCFERSRDMEYFAVLFEMGTGKSKVIVDTSAYLYSLGRINSILIVAPNGVHRKWLDEDFPLSFPDWCKFKGAIWKSSSKSSFKQCEELLSPGNFLRVLCMNVESFSSKVGFEFAKRFLNSTECLFVIDESQRIKNMEAARTKNILKLGDKAGYRRILSGTPVENSPFDLYSQFMFLDRGIFGQSYYAFKNEYAELVDGNSDLMRAIMRKSGAKFMPQIVAKDKDGRGKYKNLDKLKEIIAPYSMHVTKEECLSLPPKIYVKHHFELEKNQRKVYDELKEDLRIELGKDTVTILHKLTLLMRLQQIASGYLATDEGHLVHLFNDPKENPRIKCLLDALEDIEGSVIIWCRFVEEIQEIMKLLGDDAVAYYGEVKRDVRHQNKVDFQEGRKRFFVGNAQSGGLGLNLTKATTVIYYSNTFSFGDRKQSEDRAHRIGQDSKVLYIDLQADNTIDDKILKALESKEDLATYMTDIGQWNL